MSRFDNNRQTAKFENSATAARMRDRHRRLSGMLALCLSATALAAPPIGPDGFPTLPTDGVIELPPTPNRPGAPQFRSRTDTTARIRFNDNSDNEDGFRIQALRGGAWQTFANVGARNGRGTIERTITGLTQDTPYRFRVLAYNDAGETISASRVVYTRSAIQEPVWRVQLGVTVGNVDDAGMDDSLRVWLNSPSFTETPSGNQTWMDYGRDDFERNSHFIYDLNIVNIAERSDITRILLEHEGSDAVCIESVQLYVNGIEVFDRAFTQNGSCMFLDNDDTFAITYDQLRTHPLWQAYTTPFPPLIIRRAELESRIEGMLGHLIHDEDVYWGDRDGRAYVEASFVDDETIHVTLDFKADANNLPDPEVDISFDLKIAVGCDSTTDEVVLTVTTENFNANVSLGILGTIIDIFTPIPGGLGLPCAGGLMSCLERHIERQIEANFVPISLEIAADAPICSMGFEPTVFVDENADIRLGFRESSGVPFSFDGDIVANLNMTLIPPVVAFIAGDDGDAPEDGNEGGGVPNTGTNDDPVDAGDDGTLDATDADDSSNTSDTGNAGADDHADNAGNAGDDSASAGDNSALPEDAISVPMGCGGPMLLQGLFLVPGLMTMRRRTSANRR